MARDKNKSILKNNRRIKNNLDLLSKHLDGLYKDTYYSSKDNSKDFENIRSDIEKSIDNIMMNTYNNKSIGNIGKIYSQLQLDKAHNNSEMIQAMSIFEDPVLMNSVLESYGNNKWIRDLDNEIDTVLKYMPRLKEALNCKKDSVLSADHFAKDFVNFHNILSQDKEKLFNKRMDEIKIVYKLPDKFEEWYDDTATYGETFIYIVPYNTAFSKLLKNKTNTRYVGMEMSVISEGTLDKDSKFNSNISIEEYNNIINSGITNIKNLTITFNKSGVLTSSAESLERAKSIIEENKFASLSEIFTEQVLLNESSKTKISKPLIPNELELPKTLEDETTAQEGIYTGKAQIDAKIKIDVPGCIVKKLDKANIIPLYIDDICLGYYYLEFKNNEFISNDPNSLEYSSGINALNSSGIINRQIDQSTQNNNMIINHVANQMATVIDAEFINSNQDLRNEIYMILKHNEIFNSVGDSITGNINVSFIPAEDIVHMTFKKDDTTHRGISDLALSLFPAKLYASLYITYVLGTLTRGQDKRVYYVKQNVETNISKTLLNVLNQIKKGNFGTRQMENLSSVLNITGRFNDFIIPISQSGEAPIQFEIMEGQKFEFPSELMNMLEEMAINATGVPLELINARQSLDYAIQATMSNTKFMRNVYKRQDIVEALYSEIATKIYNYEYMEMETVEMSLPSPAFLNMTNGSSLIQGTTAYMDTLAEYEMAGEPDEVKNEFKRLGVNHYLSTHINMSLVSKLKQQAAVNVANRKTQEDSQE